MILKQSRRDFLIWTPGLNDGRKRPVMFWCHGGGFSTGSGSSPITDRTNLARRRDVVLVTINHRLNVLVANELLSKLGLNKSQMAYLNSFNDSHSNLGNLGNRPRIT